MPEGPETADTARKLNAKLQNLYLIRIKYSDNYKSRDKYNHSIEKDLPLKIEEIFTKGKRINFLCENPKNQGSVFVWFFAMTGRLCFEHRGNPLIEMIFNKNKKDNKKYSEDDDISLYYEDSRKLGFMKYAIYENEIEEIYKDVGPDFLLGEVDFEYFSKIISNPRIKNKEIGELLILNSYFSGIGNYLRAEILYASKVSPFRRLESLTDKEIKKIYDNIIKILNESLEKGGMSFRDYLDPFGKEGEFTCKVYGQKKDPKGNKVVSEKIGTPPKGKDSRRSVHWVPEIQK